MIPDAPPIRRLFFALWPDAALRDAIGHATCAAVGRAGGRPVPLGNLHLTLEFLGAVPPDTAADLAAVGAALVMPTATLLLDRYAWWRGARSLVLVATAPPAALLDLHAQLRERLRSRGLPVDERPFRPHVTLARGVGAAPPPAPVAIAWPLAEIALLESVTTPDGVRYEPRARWQRSTPEP